MGDIEPAPPVTVNVGHVVVTDPSTGRVRCSCGQFEAPARSDSEVTAHLVTHHREANRD